MSSTIQKMYRSNGIARRWLAENSYTDVHLFNHSRFSKDAHFQGLSWDGLCSKGKRLVLLQIKTNCACTKKVQEQMAIAATESGVILLWINVKKGHADVVTKE